MRWNEINEDSPRPFDKPADYSKPNSDINRTENDEAGIIFGHQVPNWAIDDDKVAVFGSNSNFMQAQVFKTTSGKFFVDFGKEKTQEFNYAGQAETALRKLHLTSFERIDYYRPSSY